MAASFLFGAAILVLLGVWRCMPRLFTPACPDCYAYLERTDEFKRLWQIKNWQIGWVKFACPECWYAHWRIGWLRGAEDDHHETGFVH